jgi:hypothetical protein
MAKKKTAAIGDFCTPEMFEEIREIGPDARRIAKEVIEPRIEEINKKLGQENDPVHLAFQIVHALSQCMGGSS